MTEDISEDFFYNVIMKLCKFLENSVDNLSFLTNVL